MKTIYYLFTESSLEQLIRQNKLHSWLVSQKDRFPKLNTITFGDRTSSSLIVSHLSRHQRKFWKLNWYPLKKIKQISYLGSKKIEKIFSLIARHLLGGVKDVLCFLQTLTLELAPHWSAGAKTCLFRTWQFTRGYVLLLNSYPIISILPKSRFGSWLSHCFTPRAVAPCALIGPTRHKHVKLALRHAK